MSQKTTNNKTIWLQAFFRICILLGSVFVGTEVALYVWEHQQYSNAIKRISTQQVQRNLTQQTYILALGDSITQLGYAKILENTKGGEYTLHNAAAAGSSVDVVKETLENNIDLLQKRQHEIIVMTGHNSCLGLTQYTKEQLGTKHSIVDVQNQEILSSIRTF